MTTQETAMIETMAAPEGPMAFPCCVPFNGGTFTAPGMTLRDYFAGQVAAGFFASKSRPTTMAEDDATWFYQVADAMLAARAAMEDTQ